MYKTDIYIYHILTNLVFSPTRWCWLLYLSIIVLSQASVCVDHWNVFPGVLKVHPFMVKMLEFKNYFLLPSNNMSVLISNWVGDGTAAYAAIHLYGTLTIPIGMC